MEHQHEYWPRDDNPSSPWYPFSGGLRLLFDSAPWQFALLLNGLEISRLSVKASIERKRFEKYFLFEDMSHLFRLESQYFVQLEAESDQLPLVSVEAELTQRELSISGVTLTFDFTRNTKELDELIHYLSKH